VPRRVQEVTLAVVERHDEPLLNHGTLFLQHSRVVTGNECLLSFKHKNNVGVAVNKVVKVGLFIPLELIQQFSLLNVFLHKTLYTINNEKFLLILSLEYITNKNGHCL
jgi:hypothetical protein